MRLTLSVLETVERTGCRKSMKIWREIVKPVSGDRRCHFREWDAHVVKSIPVARASNEVGFIGCPVVFFFFPSSLRLSSALKISGIFIIADLGQLVSRLAVQLSFDSRIINPFRARSIVVSDTFSIGNGLSRPLTFGWYVTHDARFGSFRRILNYFSGMKIVFPNLNIFAVKFVVEFDSRIKQVWIGVNWVNFYFKMLFVVSKIYTDTNRFVRLFIILEKSTFVRDNEVNYINLVTSNDTVEECTYS